MHNIKSKAQHKNKYTKDLNQNDSENAVPFHNGNTFGNKKKT